MKSNKQFRFYVLLNCLIVVIFLLFATSQSMATTYCVSDEAELIAALDNAEGNGVDDVIKIQQGTYYGNFIYALTEAFGVTMEGGYTVGCASRIVDPVNTVLDGEENGVVLALSAPDVAANFVVEGLTLQHGDFQNGGGLSVLTNSGEVTLNNNTISNNSGGGVYLRYVGTVNLSNNTISANIRYNKGGGIYLDEVGTVTLNENIINNNSADEGGGIYLEGGGTVSMTNNTITNNSATSTRGGGASFYRPAAVTLTNNIISNNISEYLGGGVGIEGGTVTLVSNTINNNITNDGNGGGVGLHSISTATLSNNIICNNSASDGAGGVRIHGGSTDLTNNTISNNSANKIGGGVLIFLDSDSNIANIYNNIIWNNNAVDGGRDVYIRNDNNNNFIPSPVSLYNNNFDHRKPEGIYIQIDFPIDSSNLDNVDPSFVDPDNDDYHLKEDSPLINAGNNLAPELPATDKDGNPRKVGSAVDIGAYEHQGFVAPVAAFMANPLIGVAPLAVEFFDESTGSTAEWYWDFGDGNDSTLQNPTNTYNVAGTYSVSLTVAGNSVSDTETKTDYITIVSPDAPDLSCKAKEFHSYEFGQKIVVKLQVENSGKTKAVPFDVAFYLSDNGISQDELLSVESVNGGLNSQHSKVVSLRYESGISLSGKHIIAVIDPDGRVLELDETNNYFLIRIP